MRTRVGYAGGTLAEPTYHHLGDHTEAFQLDYDPARVSYDELLALFWASHAPRRASRSRQYMAAVFAGDGEQLERALASRARLGDGIATPVTSGARFWRAEDYHQKYHLRHREHLMRELAHYDPRAFVDSTVAARLNGYVAGHGTAMQLHSELAAFGLSASASAEVAQIVAPRVR